MHALSFIISVVCMIFPCLSVIKSFSSSLRSRPQALQPIMTLSSPQIWLMKNEPEEYSLDHLQRDGVGIWDGIRNYQARNFMRTMKIGDKAYFYYSSCAHPGIYGIMRIAGPSFPDPKATDRTSEYYDAKSAAAGKNPWDAISVRMECRYKNPLLLPRIRELPLGECRLTARGNRLSIFPITLDQADIIGKELADLNGNADDIVYGDEKVLPSSSSTIPSTTTSAAAIDLVHKENEKKSTKKRKATEDKATIKVEEPSSKKAKKVPTTTNSRSKLSRDTVTKEENNAKRKAAKK